MLAATYTAGGSFAVQDVPLPTCGDDQIVLRVNAASICGTDVKIARFGHRKLHDGQRIVLGHEVTGTIAEIGPDVAGFQLGQRVGVAPNIGCGRCVSCVAGRSNYCPDFSAIGINMDGSHAPYMRLDAAYMRQGNLLALPESLSDRAATLLEPLSCVIGGVEAASIEPGNAVVVYGAGPMGLLHVMLAGAMGAAQVVAVDMQDSRLERAVALGATHVINGTSPDVVAKVRSWTNGRGADVAVVACPAPSAQEQAVELLAIGGRLSLFAGLPKGADTIRFDSNAVHYKNLHVTGTTGGTVRNYQTAIQLAAAKKIDLEKIISDVFALSDLSGAFKKAMTGASGKIVLMAG